VYGDPCLSPCQSPYLRKPALALALSPFLSPSKTKSQEEPSTSRYLKKKEKKMSIFSLSSKHRLEITLTISFLFFAAELSVGFYTKSLALVADAFHYVS
jgi:hypothetical protein